MDGERKMTQDTCKLLKEIADALYHIYESKPKGIHYQKYETLYLQTIDLIKKLGCKP